MAKYNKTVTLPFTVEFEYFLDDNDGMDGFVFMFNKNLNYQPASGEYMGFSDGTDIAGYGVEFDGSGTYWNEYDPIDGRHLSLLRGNVNNFLSYRSLNELEHRGWNKSTINVTDTTVTVSINNKEVLHYKNETYFKNGFENIALSAGTGVGFSCHKIRNFKFK